MNSRSLLSECFVCVFIVSAFFAPSSYGDALIIINAAPINFIGTRAVTQFIDVAPISFNGRAGVIREIAVDPVDANDSGDVPVVIDADPVAVVQRDDELIIINAAPINFTGTRAVTRFIDVAPINFNGRNGVIGGEGGVGREEEPMGDDGGGRPVEEPMGDDGGGRSAEPEGDENPVLAIRDQILAEDNDEKRHELRGDLGERLSDETTPGADVSAGNRQQDSPIDDPIDMMARRTQGASAPERTEIRTTILQVRSLNQNGNTDPFNFTDVQEDVVVAQTPEEEAQPTGEES
ncbi:MAG: hypothetical protein ISR97_00400, partial [Nitrospira sp.]|nr:hypothetical protein [Nitrospira sp.]